MSLHVKVESCDTVNSHDYTQPVNISQKENQLNAIYLFFARQPAKNKLSEQISPSPRPEQNLEREDMLANTTEFHANHENAKKNY
jgi:hypothetical protein